MYFQDQICLFCALKKNRTNKLEGLLRCKPLIKLKRNLKQIQSASVKLLYCRLIVHILLKQTVLH